MAVTLLFTQNIFAAANFSITPSGTLPAHIAAGQTVSAFYIVINMTPLSRNGYTVQGLPSVVSQNTTSPNCSNPISLAPHASCQLQLDITGAVSSNFAICKGSACTTAASPLNVSVASPSPPTPPPAPPLPPTPPPPPSPRVAYVAGFHSVYVCPVNTDGSLAPCIDSTFDFSGFWPQGIAINDNGTAAFITGNGNIGPYLYQCSINPTDHTFSSCSQVTVTSPTDYAGGNGFLALNSTNTTTYLVDDNVNASTPRVLACPIGSGNCTDVGATGLSGYPAGIALNIANTKAYIGGYNDQAITICSVNNNSFSSCTNKLGGGAVTSFVPVGVALNPAETSLYIADQSSNNVYHCDITHLDATPYFSSCDIAGTLSSSAYTWGITLNKAGTMAYITNSGTNLYSCPIMSDGSFSPCAQITGFAGTMGVALLY